MFRRQALVDVGGLREELNASEDIDLFLRLAERGKLMNLDAVVLKWRLHPSSTGGRKANWTMEAKRKAVRDAHERRGIPLPQEDPIVLGPNHPAIRSVCGLGGRLRPRTFARRESSHGRRCGNRP
jgi:hypothetical protein